MGLIGEAPLLGLGSFGLEDLWELHLMRTHSSSIPNMRTPKQDTPPIHRNSHISSEPAKKDP